MHDNVHSLDRRAFVALVALVLTPVVVHGLWLPLAHFTGPGGSALAVTLSAVAVSVSCLGVHWFGGKYRTLSALVTAAAVAALLTAGMSLGLAAWLSMVGVAAMVGWLASWLPAHLPAELDGLARQNKILTAIYVLAAATAVVSTARVSTFIGDPSRVDMQALPGEQFLERHSCLTAYVHASQLVRQGVDNVYDAQWWRGSHGFAPPAEGARTGYEPFDLDYFVYPPPFLLVTLPLVPLDGDYPAQRALWFGFGGLLLAAGLWLVAHWLQGPRSHRVLLLAPVFYGTLPVLATLQVGNFQIAVVVLSVLGMVAHASDRPALGGALLAFAIWSKISPGILLIGLLAQHRWRSLGWTALFGCLFMVASWFVFGSAPLVAFVRYALPRLASGEAFAFMDDDDFSIVTNMAPFGVPFKLQLLGLSIADPWEVGRVVARCYSVVLVAIAAWTAMRPTGDRRSQTLAWMSLLVLAAVQSPFAPGYILIALLWGLTLLAPEIEHWRSGTALTVLWIGLVLLPPTRAMPVLAAQTLAQSLVAIAVPIWLIGRTPRRLPG